MKHSKLCVFLAAAVMVLSACTAFAEGVKIGMLMPAKLVAGIDEQTQDVNDIIVWDLKNPAHKAGNFPRFYGNLAAMLMALNAGELDEFAVSQPVGEYIIAVNPDFAVACATRITGSTFVFGFRAENGRAIRDKFNAALADIRKDGTLDALKLKYCSNPGKGNLDTVQFESFSDAETVKIAVTGDLPPLDFVTADGNAAGFNTAILSEIGRRAKINIKLVYVETAARTTALMSGRADCIFWYQLYNDSKNQPDSPEGVIFSEPYYDFNIMLHIGRKQPEKH